MASVPKKIQLLVSEKIKIILTLLVSKNLFSWIPMTRTNYQEAAFGFCVLKEGFFLKSRNYRSTLSLLFTRLSYTDSVFIQMLLPFCCNTDHLWKSFLPTAIRIQQLPDELISMSYSNT